MAGKIGPSAQVVESLERMGWKAPVVSRWGPAGGRFTELAGTMGKDAYLVQTCFFGKQSPVELAPRNLIENALTHTPPGAPAHRVADIQGGAFETSELITGGEPSYRIVEAAPAS